MIYGGNLRITKDNQDEYASLVEVTGNLTILEDFTAPMLESVGGYLKVHADFAAPMLKTVSGKEYGYLQFSVPEEAITQVKILMGVTR